MTDLELKGIALSVVPRQKYWGAQTQRSPENFKIGSDKILYFL